MSFTTTTAVFCFGVKQMQLLFKYDHSNCSDDIEVWIDDLLQKLQSVKSYTVYPAWPADHFTIDFVETKLSWIDFLRQIEKVTGAEFLGRTV